MLEIVGVLAAVAGVVIAYVTLKYQKKAHAEVVRNSFVQEKVSSQEISGPSKLEPTAFAAEDTALPHSVSLIREKIRDWRFDQVSPQFDPEKEEEGFHLWQQYNKQLEENYVFSSSVELEFPLHARIVKYTLLQTIYSVEIMRGAYSNHHGRPLPRRFGRGYPISFKVRQDYRSGDYVKHVDITDDVVILDVSGNEFLFSVDMPSRRFGGALKFEIVANGPDDCRVKLTQVAFGPKKNLLIDALRSLDKGEPNTGPFLERELMEFLEKLFHTSRCIAEFGCDPAHLAPFSWMRTWGSEGTILYGIGDGDKTPDAGRSYQEDDQIFYLQTDERKGLIADNPDWWYEPYSPVELVYVAKKHSESVKKTPNVAQRDDHIILTKWQGQDNDVPNIDPLTEYVSEVIFVDEARQNPGEKRGIRNGELLYVIDDVGTR